MATIKYENRLKHKVFSTMTDYLITKVNLKRRMQFLCKKGTLHQSRKLKRRVFHCLVQNHRISTRENQKIEQIEGRVRFNMIS
jgi:hypothetical protein